MTVVENELSGHRLVSEDQSLEQDVFYPIKLEYFEDTSNAFITLVWREASLTSEADRVIPSSHFYYERSLVPISG
jgi:hypothetical protein